MALAVLKLLEELRLSLVVEVRVLELLLVTQPDRRIEGLCVRLDRPTHALADLQRH